MPPFYGCIEANRLPNGTWWIQLKCHSFIHLFNSAVISELFLFGVSSRIPMHFEIFPKFSSWPFWDSTQSQLKRRLLRIQLLLNSLAQLTVGLSKRKHVQCSVFNKRKEKGQTMFYYYYWNLLVEFRLGFELNTLILFEQSSLFFSFLFFFLYCRCCCWIVNDEILFYRIFHKPRFGL